MASNKDADLRSRIRACVCAGVTPLDGVLAGWESGSVAFDREDAYSDIDLNLLLDDGCATDAVFDVVATALESVSPVVGSHSSPPGRYFTLRDVGDYLLVDVCLYRRAEVAERLDAARHGKVKPLFDKGDWLKTDADAVRAAQVAARAQRLAEHRAWFTTSQGFVRKAIRRDRDIDGLASYWAYTAQPLVELLRMQHCPARWDFGMRYLEQDVPAAVYAELRDVLFVGDPEELPLKHAAAVAWAERLLNELAEGAEKTD